MPPPNESDAIKIMYGIKERYEKFHAVAYTDEAIETSVFASSRFIPDRFLPDKAIDLIDEAGARVKLKQTTLPTDVSEVQKRIKFIVHRMENAIANHEFEKARFYSDEERKERENLRALRMIGGQNFQQFYGCHQSPTVGPRPMKFGVFGHPCNPAVHI